METKTVNLSRLNEAQLNHVATELGIEYNGEETNEQMRELISATTDKKSFEVSTEPEQKAPGDGVPTVQADKDPEKTKKAPVKQELKWRKILIPSSESLDGNSSVPVSVNGVACYLPRDKKIEIPEYYYHALKNAVKTIYESEELENGKMETVSREVPSINFSVLSDDEPDCERVKISGMVRG